MPFSHSARKQQEVSQLQDKLKDLKMRKNDVKAATQAAGLKVTEKRETFEKVSQENLADR